MRCPYCGGLNAADSRWCGQCLRKFEDAAPPPPEPAPVESPVLAEAAISSMPSEAPRAADGNGRSVVTQTRRHGAFAVTAHGLTWSCPMCEHENPVESMICAMCGAPFAALMKEPEAERPQRDPGMVALLSLFLPGAGHAYMGMWAQAVSRAVVVVWTIVVTLIAGVQGGSGSAPMALAFGFATLALWVVTAHDAFREASGDKGSVILKNRTFLYVVIALLGLLFVLVFSAAVNLAGSG